MDVDIAAWDKMAKAMEDGEVMEEGKVVDVVKGGLLVGCGAQRLCSRIFGGEIGFANQLDAYKGTTIQAKLLNVIKITTN